MEESKEGVTNDFREDIEEFKQSKHIMEICYKKAKPVLDLDNLLVDYLENFMLDR